MVREKNLTKKKKKIKIPLSYPSKIAPSKKTKKKEEKKKKKKAKRKKQNVLQVALLYYGQ